MNGITLAQINVDATWLEYGAFGLLAALLALIAVTVWRFLPLILDKWEKHIEVQRDMATAYAALAHAIGDVDSTVDAIKAALDGKAVESTERHRQVMTAMKNQKEMLRVLLRQKEHKERNGS